MLFATVACSEGIRETAAAASFRDDEMRPTQVWFCDIGIVVKPNQFCKLDLQMFIALGLLFLSNV